MAERLQQEPPELDFVHTGPGTLAGRYLRMFWQPIHRAQDLPYNLFRIEDYCTQVGQGAIADRANEHLGQNDVATVAIRKLWERELRATAEHLRLTEWRMPDHLELAEAGSAHHASG